MHFRPRGVDNGVSVYSIFIHSANPFYFLADFFQFGVLKQYFDPNSLVISCSLIFVFKTAPSRGFFFFQITHMVWKKMSEFQKCASSGKNLRYLGGKCTRYCVVLGKKQSENFGFRNAVVGRWLFEARRWDWLTRLQRRVRRRWWVHPPTAQSQE